MFRIAFTGDSEVKKRLTDKFHAVKEQIQRDCKDLVTNTHALEFILDSWMSKHSEDKTIRNGYIGVTQDMTDEKIFMTTKTSLERCMEIAHKHARVCNSQLRVQCLIRKGHTALTTLRCSNTAYGHHIKWSSSSYLPNGEYLVNQRIYHGYVSSGQIPVQYTRFCEAADIGVINWRDRQAMCDR